MDSRSRKMIRLLVAAAVLIAPLSAVTMAQAKPVSIDGKWNMTVTMPDGTAMPVATVFKTEGKKVTGSLTSPQGETPLEGEYADGKIKFGITVPGDGGSPMTIGFAGDLKADGTLAGVASGPMGELPWKAERVK